MAESAGYVIGGILELYNSFLASLPTWAQNFTNLFFLVVTILIFSVIIWNFHKIVAKKNIIILNLNKYNKYTNSITNKALSKILYFLEYIIVTPFFIFLWFSVITFFLVLLTENIDIQRILLIAAIVVSAVRMSSYYSEDLSKEIAKLLPFNLLAIAILTPGFFDFNRIISNFSNLAAFFDNVFIYLLFIAGLEILLRFFDFIFSMFETDKD